ncbi:MAG TPA: hypothetical protein VMG30_18865 [Acidobacteriota bacterium]|nr:hypothetical protein [Acidobacteriota bacterium]
MRKAALCLHDIRLSGNGDSARLIDSVSRVFHAPLTVHLVVDAAIDPALPLMVYLRERIRDGAMEVVFHGLTHICPPGVWPYLAWYHKGQAEYAVNDPAAREQAGKAYARLSATLGQLPGICPPCWLCTKENRAFLASLSPPYVESMFALERKGRRRFSPIISIGSSRARDLVALELLARSMLLLSHLLPEARVRVAVHPSDTANPRVMSFLKTTYGKLLERGAEPVLLNSLVFGGL